MSDTSTTTIAADERRIPGPRPAGDTTGIPLR